MFFAVDENGNIIITTGLYGLTALEYPAASIENADISGSAAIDASKCERGMTTMVSQAGNASTATYIVRVAQNDGALKRFVASNTTACGGSTTVAVDLLNNGASVLAAALSLDSATGARGEEVATISTPGYVDGDVLEVVITISQNGTDALPTNVCAQLDFDEAYTA